ncbi:cellulose synthase, partial [Antarcticirhabdus aurantiaca]
MIGLAAGLAVALQGSASAAPAAPTHWDATSEPAALVVAANVEPFSATLAQAPAPAPTTPRSGAAVPATPAAPQAEAPESQPVARPPAVDETALRYFARQGDTRRLEAEIARLKALYPDWQPPENPLEIEDAGDPELDRIWELYSQGRYAEVRAAIAARQASEPGWQPPADLLDRLAVAEARVQLVNASNLQQWQAVIRVASATPSLLTCSEVDVLWRVARAFIETGRPDRGRDAYLYVLTQCDNDAERLATMQMATQRLPRPELDPLLATERKGPDGVGEFASIRADLARASLAEAADDAAVVVAAADLDTVTRLADAEGRASDNELLGWYALRRADYPQALARFERARAAQDSSTVSQGYALALIQLARFAEAESAMVPWREASDGARAVYLAAVANLLAAPGGAAIDQAVLARAVDAAAQARDAATAQQIGWYAFSLNQFPTAAQWFATALAWKADDEPAAFGLALARQRLGDAGGLAALQREWSARSPRIAAIGREDGEGIAADASGAGIAQAEAPRARQVAATETPARPRAALRERPAAA